MKKYAIIGPFILIIVWAVISRCQLVDAFFLPGPITTISKLLELIKSGVIIDDLVSTLGRVGLSFVIALIIGLPLGLILGMSEKIYRSVEFIIDFLKFIFL